MSTSLSICEENASLVGRFPPKWAKYFENGFHVSYWLYVPSYLRIKRIKQCFIDACAWIYALYSTSGKPTRWTANNIDVIIKNQHVEQRTISMSLSKTNTLKSDQYWCHHEGDVILPQKTAWRVRQHHYQRRCGYSSWTLQYTLIYVAMRHGISWPVYMFHFITSCGSVTNFSNAVDMSVRLMLSYKYS